MENIVYPVRVNRFLYLKGYCSRRKADEYISKGLVLINGKPAVLGQKVEEGDNVEIADFVAQLPEKYEYYLFHKPAGIVSHNPQGGERAVEDIFKKSVPLSPIGRLDKASTGLMLLTNDGRIVDKMLNPKYEHEKEYRVRVDKNISARFLRKMREGVTIEGYKTRPAEVEQTGEKAFKITLTEGKKHQIRRMCAALGFQVRELKRTRIMNLRLGKLPVGQGRAIKPEEKFKLLKSVGI